MNIGVIGGDARIIELVKILKEKNNECYLLGCENNDDLLEFQHFDNMKELMEKSDLLITSIPISKDGITVNCNYSNKKIYVKEIFEIAKQKKIVTGNVTDEISKYIVEKNENEIIDVLKKEELTILNAIPTAEGAIQIAMENSNKTLHGSKCLVLGFGRIGKILSKMLYGIGACVSCEARKETDIAWIKAYGYNDIKLTDLNEYLGDFDFIFNTIPYIVLDKNNLNLVKKDCVLIDLASKPGGIDFNEANNLNLTNIWALALPGKVASRTSAKYIYDAIKNMNLLK